MKILESKKMVARHDLMNTTSTFNTCVAAKLDDWTEGKGIQVEKVPDGVRFTQNVDNFWGKDSKTSLTLTMNQSAQHGKLGVEVRTTEGQGFFGNLTDGQKNGSYGDADSKAMMMPAYPPRQDTFQFTGKLPQDSTALTNHLKVQGEIRQILGVCNTPAMNPSF